MPVAADNCYRNVSRTALLRWSRIGHNAGSPSGWSCVRIERDGRFRAARIAHLTFRGRPQGGAPTQCNSAIRDVSTFATGSFTVLSTGGTMTAPKVDEDCNFNFKIHGLQTAVVSGTGVFAHATGHFTAEVNIAGVFPRNPDGSCNQNANPLFDTVHVTASGHLKL
jgi:hypothetical protein